MKKLLVGLGIGIQAVFAMLAPISAHGEFLTLAQVTDSPFTVLTWNTEPSDSLVALFFKDGSTFLNPNDEALNVDLSAPGVYTFGLRLNKGIGREMDGYTLNLTFDGAGSPQISVAGTRDTTGGSPSFSGTVTFGAITLTGLRISSFDAVDEVGEFTATTDGNIDYIGSVELTVVPEPSTALLVGLSAMSALVLRRRK